MATINGARLLYGSLSDRTRPNMDQHGTVTTSVSSESHQNSGTASKTWAEALAPHLALVGSYANLHLLFPNSTCRSWTLTDLSSGRRGNILYNIIGMYLLQINHSRPMQLHPYTQIRDGLHTTDRIMSSTWSGSELPYARPVSRTGRLKSSEVSTHQKGADGATM